MYLIDVVGDEHDGPTRLERLKELMDEFQQTPDDYDAGEEEDVRPYFNGEREPDRWAVVTVNYTSHNEPKWFFLTVPDASHAKSRATEYAHDDIFEELPVAVVDLDSGVRFDADWHAVPWRKVN